MVCFIRVETFPTLVSWSADFIVNWEGLTVKCYTGRLLRRTAVGAGLGIKIARDKSSQRFSVASTVACIYT